MARDKSLFPLLCRLIRERVIYYNCYHQAHTVPSTWHAFMSGGRFQLGIFSCSNSSQRKRPTTWHISWILSGGNGSGKYRSALREYHGPCPVIPRKHMMWKYINMENLGELLRNAFERKLKWGHCMIKLQGRNNTQSHGTLHHSEQHVRRNRPRYGVESQQDIRHAYDIYVP